MRRGPLRGGQDRGRGRDPAPDDGGRAAGAVPGPPAGTVRAGRARLSKLGRGPRPVRRGHGADGLPTPGAATAPGAHRDRREPPRPGPQLPRGVRRLSPGLRPGRHGHARAAGRRGPGGGVRRARPGAHGPAAPRPGGPGPLRLLRAQPGRPDRPAHPAGRIRGQRSGSPAQPAPHPRRRPGLLPPLRGRPTGRVLLRQRGPQPGGGGGRPGRRGPRPPPGRRAPPAWGGRRPSGPPGSPPSTWTARRPRGSA